MHKYSLGQVLKVLSKECVTLKYSASSLIKDPKGKSYSFKQHSGKGAAQWTALKEKKERFPWLEIIYVVRFNRKEWRYFTFPEDTGPLRLKDGSKLEPMFEYLLEGQNNLSISIMGGS